VVGVPNLCFFLREDVCCRGHLIRKSASRVCIPKVDLRNLMLGPALPPYSTIQSVVSVAAGTVDTVSPTWNRCSSRRHCLLTTSTEYGFSLEADCELCMTRLTARVPVSGFWVARRRDLHHQLPTTRSKSAIVIFPRSCVLLFRYNEGLLGHGIGYRHVFSIVGMNMCLTDMRNGPRRSS